MKELTQEEKLVKIKRKLLECFDQRLLLPPEALKILLQGYLEDYDRDPDAWEPYEPPK